jgi:hypothetical protein
MNHGPDQCPAGAATTWELHGHPLVANTLYLYLYFRAGRGQGVRGLPSGEWLACSAVRMCHSGVVLRLSPYAVCIMWYN